MKKFFAFVLVFILLITPVSQVFAQGESQVEKSTFRDSDGEIKTIIVKESVLSRDVYLLDSSRKEEMALHYDFSTSMINGHINNREISLSANELLEVENTNIASRSPYHTYTQKISWASIIKVIGYTFTAAQVITAVAALVGGEAVISKAARSFIVDRLSSLSKDLLGDSNWASNHGILLYCEQNWAYVWRKGKKVKVMKTVVTNCSFY